MNDDVLTFGKGNAKLGKNIVTFSLLSGVTCPGAKLCRSWVSNGRIVDGPDTVFRCFSAMSEATYPVAYTSRKRNLDVVRKHLANGTLVDLIDSQLSPKVNMVRIHVAGDFFNQAYFDAWMEVARRRPGVIFYAYTKSINFWVKRINDIPDNFRLTASYGGRHDDLIGKHKLKSAVVVYSVEEAVAKGLNIDHDDSYAYSADNTSFALLLHGVQPAGTVASKALSKLRKQGVGGYGKNKLVKV